MAPLDLEKLLSQDAWIRRLARRLALDPDVADDLAQDAWVATLTARRLSDAERPWLGGVVRNLWRGLRRGEARRREREDRVADLRAEHEPGPAELVEELTLRRELAAALLALEEPYRTTLWRRFFQDRSISSLAREEGVPISTVHDRVKRGLARLRVRLDGAYGGERRAWAGTLLGLAQPAGLATTLIGGLVMGTGTKIAASAAVVGGALLWALTGGDGGAHDEPPAELVHASGPEPAPVELRTEDTAGVREALPQAPVEALAPTPGTRPEASSLLEGRVLDTLGGEVVGLPVAFVHEDGRRAGEASVETDGRGEFRLPRGEEASSHVASVHPDFTNLVLGVVEPSVYEGLDERATIIVAPRASFAGVVVDSDHRPLAQVQLGFQVRQSLFRKLGIPRPFPPDIEAFETITAADGLFSLPDLAGGEDVYLSAFLEGYLRQEVELAPAGDAGLVIVMERDTKELLLNGRVVDARGRGVAGARVSAGSDIVTTDAAGAFVLPWRDEPTGPYARDEHGTWRRELDSSVLRAVKVGFLPAELALENPDPERTLLLRLGDEPLCLRGRVVDGNGRPLPGAAVWAARLQPFGERRTADENSVAMFPESLEESLIEPYAGCGARTDEEGRFELCGLLDKAYQFLVLEPRTLSRAGPFEAHPRDGEVEFLLRAEPRTGRVAGRVVNARGNPLVGVKVEPQRAPTERGLRDVPWGLSVSLKQTTDEQGWFAFEEIATEGTILQLSHDAFFLRHVPLAGHDDLGDLLLVEPVLCNLEVDLGSEPDLADALKVLDEDGEELELLVSHGVFLSMAPEATIEDGRSGVMRVKETARTLVLLRDEVEVLRRPLRVDPDELTIARP